MDWAFDGNLLSRVLLTIATVGYGFVTILVDFNRTHATNPQWTAHARFHLVWQILSYSGIALVSLGLIWLPGPLGGPRLYLAGALGIAVYGAFFIAALARPAFGGTLYDENGYPPFSVPVAGARWQGDVNVTAFSVLSILLALGLLAVTP